MEPDILDLIQMPRPCIDVCGFWRRCFIFVSVGIWRRGSPAWSTISRAVWRPALVRWTQRNTELWSARSACFWREKPDRLRLTWSSKWRRRRRHWNLSRLPVCGINCRLSKNWPRCSRGLFAVKEKKVWTVYSGFMTRPQGQWRSWAAILAWRRLLTAWNASIYPICKAQKL